MKIFDKDGSTINTQHRDRQEELHSRMKGNETRFYNTLKIIAIILILIAAFLDFKNF